MIATSEPMPTKITTYGNLRENLVTLRNARGLSQAELSRRSGVGQSTISRIESGSQADSEWGTIEALARALGADPSELTGKTAPQRRPDVASQPAVGRTPIGSLLPDYISSEWFERDHPTHDEMRWLASLGVITWTGAPPTAGTVHALLDEHRKGNLP